MIGQKIYFGLNEMCSMNFGNGMDQNEMECENFENINFNLIDQKLRHDTFVTR